VEVEVRVDFVAVARPSGAGWELRLPLTVPPRYVREDEAGKPDSNPLALAIDPGHRFSMDLKIRDGRDIASSTHEIAVALEDRVPGVAAVTLAKGQVVPDRDFLLSWRPNMGRVPLGGVLYAENDGDDTYFLLLAGADAEKADALFLPREVAVLIDHSGSMSGAKWATADWAAQKFLSDLKKNDRFNLAFFHNDVYLFSGAMLEATAENVSKAGKFAAENKTSGGTNLGVALERMLLIPRVASKQKLSRQLLVITDAQVTDSGRILALARRESGSGLRRRISVLCIDAAPNSTLTNRLAELGGGTAVYLTSNPEAEDVTTAVDALLDKWSRPVAETVTLTLNAKELRVPGRHSGLDGTRKSAGEITADLGSLMGGEPLWTVGNISGFQPEEPVWAAFDGVVVSLDVKSTLDVKNINMKDAIKTLYGARQIQELEYVKTSGAIDLPGELLALGYPAEPTKSADSPLYRENKIRFWGEVVDQLLLEEALKYGVVSSRTALVASRTEKGKPVGGTVWVPNALPQGWDDRSSVGVSVFMPLAMSMAEVTMTKSDRPETSGVRGPGAFVGDNRLGISRGGAVSAPAIAAPIEEMNENPHSEIYDAEAAVPGRKGATAPGEVLLKEIGKGISESPGSGRLSELVLTKASRDALLKGGQKLDKLFVCVYVDGGAKASARIRLSDLVKLGKRPLNLAYGKSLRFTLVNEDDSPATLKKLSISILDA
jgi:Ca-activated chloride channel family protein